MVAKIISGKYIKGMLNYNEKKVLDGSARLILANGFAMDIGRLDLKGKLKRFEYRTMLNTRAKTNAIHISLNFHAKDKLDDQTLQQIAVRYMEGIGFGEQPFLVYRHLDAGHPHIHIATTNILADGKRMDIHNLGKGLSEQARKSLEVSFGLIRAEAAGREQRQGPIMRARYGQAPTKKQLDMITSLVFQQYRYGSFNEYQAILACLGIVADRGPQGSRMMERKGLTYSILDKGAAIGVSFKASRLQARPTLARLEKRFEKNVEIRRPMTEEIRQKILGTLDRYERISRKTFITELAKLQLHAIFLENKQGRVYGLTFVDHALRCAIKGSDLGKGFSAGALMGQFTQVDSAKNYTRSIGTGQQVHEHAGIRPTSSLLEQLLDNTQREEGLAYIGKRRRRKTGQSQQRSQ